MCLCFQSNIIPFIILVSHELIDFYLFHFFLDFKKNSIFNISMNSVYFKCCFIEVMIFFVYILSMFFIITTVYLEMWNALSKFHEFILHMMQISKLVNLLTQILISPSICANTTDKKLHKVKPITENCCEIYSWSISIKMVGKNLETFIKKSNNFISSI